MTIEITKDEAYMIVYALKETASRRYVQAIDGRNNDIKQEAQQHLLLADRICDAANKKPA